MVRAVTDFVLTAPTRYLERKIEEHRIAGLEPKITSKPKTKPGKKFRGAPGIAILKEKRRICGVFL